MTIHKRLGSTLATSTGTKKRKSILDLNYRQEEYNSRRIRKVGNNKMERRPGVKEFKSSDEKNSQVQFDIISLCDDTKKNTGAQESLVVTQDISSTEIKEEKKSFGTESILKESETKANHSDKPISRRGARYSFEDELRKFQRSGPKSTKKKIKHWLGKSVSKPCADSAYKYIPVSNANKKSTSSFLIKKTIGTTPETKKIHENMAKEKEKDSYSTNTIWTNVGLKDYDEENFEDEVLNFEKRFSAFDLETNGYSRDVRYMRDRRRKRFIIGFIILSCVLLAGIFAGYEDAKRSKKNNQSDKKNIHVVHSNITTNYDSKYSFVPRWNELCTPESLHHKEGLEECRKICEDFSCCAHPEGSIERCFQHKPDICHKVNELCAQILGIEEDSKHTVPPATLTIKEDCDMSNILTERGREQCENSCFPGACCISPKESGINCDHGKNTEACKSYSVCSNLSGGVGPDVVTEECGKAETSVESFNECSEMCQSYLCCFRGNIHLHCPHNKMVCEEYSSCKIMIKIFDGGLEPGNR